MIIPYGHESDTVRRLPWVSFVLIALCVLTFLAFNLLGSDDDTRRETAIRLNDVLVYYSTHPYLEMDSRLEAFLRERLPRRDFEQLEISLQAVKRFAGPGPESAEVRRAEQEELGRRVDRLLAALADIYDGPFFRWGLVPAHFKLHALLTYQFLHAGFWHLAFNMLFLFLAAPFIEDVWGRPLFAVFFLLAGAVAGLMYAVHYPDFQGPLIGASGAVAGVMGAFLVRCWNTRIRFLYWFFPVRPLYGTFSSPAWVMLPLWFLLELFNAQAGDVMAPASGGGGVAHWAHVWGFGFGLAAAGVMVYLKVEERFIHPAIESKITLFDNSVVDAAMEARSEGRLDQAASLLRQELRSHPQNIDAAVAWWNLSVASGATKEVAPHLLRAVRAALQRDDPSPVLNHWHELLEAAPELAIDPQLGARVAEILHDHGRDDDVTTTVAAAARAVARATPPGVVVRLARLAAVVAAPEQEALLATALAAPDLPAEVRGELEALAPAQRIVEETAPPSPTPEPPPAAAPLALAPRTLQTMEVVPRALDEEALIVEVRGATRRVPLTQVQAIAVAGVRRDEGRPLLVVDLLLDAPWSERPSLRSLRLLSTAFDPRRLVGGGDTLAAFRNLLARLLSISGAVPLPDPDAARGEPFRTYSTLETYQREALGIDGE